MSTQTSRHRHRVAGTLAALTLAVTGLPGLLGGPAATPAGAAIPPAATGGFTGVTPVRLLDTRNNPAGPTGAASGCVAGTRGLRVVGTGSPAPVDAAVVALNVTVVNPSLPGFVTVFPGGTSLPPASSLNYVAGQVVPNNVIVKVGGFGIVNLFASGGCPHLVVDVVGYFAPGTPSAGGITGIEPERLLDTRRPGEGPCVNGVRTAQVAGQPFSAVPADASAVALNVTVVSPTLPGYLTVFPKGATQPTASTLNYTPGQVVPNGTVVKVGSDGSIALFANAGCPNVIVDVVGYFSPGAPTSAGGFFGVNPYRLLDSRTAGQVPCLGGTRSYSLTVAGVDGSAVPAESRAVALNVTVTGATVPGFVTVYPSGTTRPTSSNLNYVGGQTVPNGVLVKVGTTQSIELFASGGCPDLIVDVVGGFTATPIPLVDGCTASGTLVAACRWYQQTSIAPPSTAIGEVVGRQAVSADGRYVAFASGITSQIFHRDLATGLTRLVSHSPTGALGDDSSYEPAISADGRYVVFISDAINLSTVEKTNFVSEAYRWDATTDTLLRIGYDPTRVGDEEPNGDAWSPSVSDDGNRICIISDAENLAVIDNPSLIGEALVYTVSTNSWVDASKQPLIISPPDGVDSAQISGNGRYVAFTSDDPNATFDTNEAADVYRRDLQLLTTEWVTRRPTGGPATEGGGDQAISADGRYVAFVSLSNQWDFDANDAGLTYDVFVRDMSTSAVTRVSRTPAGGVLNGDSYAPSISANGRLVSYLTDATDAVPDDTNGVTDLVVRDTVAGTNVRASVNPALGQLTSGVYDSVLSADGKYAGWSTAQAVFPADDHIGADSVLRFLAATPVISTVTPTALSAGTAPTITVTGSGFASDAVPVVDGEGVTVSGVAVNAAGTQVTFTLTVAASGAAGRHDLWIRNPGGVGFPYGGSVTLGRTGLLRVT
ncbi:MAG: hypothetical protein ACKO72_01115 [Actinomycetes bacterium]